MSAFDSAVSAPWAMLPERVEELLSIAARENTVTPEVLEAYRAQHAERGERVTVRDGVAILDVSGPLFKKANLFVSFSGATSYEILRRDLQVAIDDPAIHGIMIKVDSPGGEANGCDELAKAIYDARGVKPVTAFVSGMACSGGYWLASAAENVIVSDLAVLGSIGVVLGVTDRRKADENRGVQHIEFVSSQSPGKRPDVATDEGKARIQKMVDDLAEVFVSAVAKYRGVSQDTVIEKFGAGGVEIGANAVAAGMADQVGDFESALKALSSRGTGRRNNRSSNGGILMSDKTNAAVEDNIDVAKLQSEAAQKATADALVRVKAIQTSEEGKARPKLAEHLAFDTNLSADSALGILKAAAVEGDGGKADAQSYEDRKTDAGALGLAKPETPSASAEAAQAGWAKAFARTSAR